MKFKLYESTLNECVGSPSQRLVAEIEADTLEEAHKKVSQMYPEVKVYSLKSDS